MTPPPDADTDLGDAEGTESEPGERRAEEVGPGLIEALRSWVHYEHAPLITVAVAAIVWVVVLGRLILLRHHNIGTFGFDEGIYDQMLWQLGHFRTFDT